MLLAGGNGPMEAGQSGMPTSLSDFITPTTTVATISATPTPITSPSDVKDWTLGWVILGILLLVLALVRSFKKH